MRGAFGFATLFALVSCAPEAPPPAPPRSPPKPQFPAPIGPEPQVASQFHVGEIKPGDSLFTALTRLDVSGSVVDRLVKALNGVLDLRVCRPGEWFEVWKDEAGEPFWFRYHRSTTEVVLAYRDGEGRWFGRRQYVHVTTRTAAVAGRVNESLYESMEALGEQAWLPLTMVDVFAWDIDFFTETRSGDEFRVVVEKKSLDGQPVGYGALLAAEYRLAQSGRAHRAFRYQLENGKIGYYDDDGRAVEKAYLKSPVKFASITSRYGYRRHPILRYRRAHRGVDYGAPRGTAIWAIAGGTVAYAGRRGGYGRVVYLRHANGLETRYAHLRGYGRGIRRGRKVRQKQVIGYVGMSGLATGPHLHFEVLRNGRHMNPLALRAPPAPPIPRAELERYKVAIAPSRAALDQADVVDERQLAPENERDEDAEAPLGDPSGVDGEAVTSGAR